MAGKDEKKPEKKGPSDREMIAMIVAVLKANGLSLPKALADAD